MTGVRLLVDMNLSPRWVDWLGAAGISAVHWSAIGAVNAPDVEVMDWARANGRVVLTHDLDFGSILAATLGKQPSVVQIRAGDPSPEAIGPAVLAALRQTEADLKQGALLTVEPGRARIRLLPLPGGS
jgi:predicted nuclease of predicted toxin-antitoxin system